jgi:hypothetical protein
MNIRISLPIVLIVAALVGYFSYQTGKSSAPLASSPPGDEFKERFEALQGKMQKISNEDFQEYLSLKDKAEQYAKAEEILGKVMMLFLADLGIRMSKSDIEKVARMASAPASAPEPPPAPAPPTLSPPDTNELPKSPHPAPAVAGPPWPAAQEKKLPEVHSREDARAFLKTVALDNIFGAVKSSKPLDPAALTFLNGNWGGRIAMDAEGDPSMRLRLEINGVRETGSGEYKITVTSGKDSKSVTSGKGSFKDFRSADGSTVQAVIVRSTPTSYLQLYSTARGDMLIGNFYREKSADEYVKAGSVILERR